MTKLKELEIKALKEQVRRLEKIAVDGVKYGYHVTYVEACVADYEKCKVRDIENNIKEFDK